MLLRLLVLVIFLVQMPYVFGNDGLDVVFIIDQSASMSGSALHPTANDRHEHRISIVKNVVHRLAEHVEDTSLVHRISIVEFGSRVNVPISNLELSYDPSAPAGTMARNALWEIQAFFKSREMNNTNTPKGIKATLAEFRKLSAANTSGGKRQRQLLFITDGRPRVRRPAFTGRLVRMSRLWREIEKNHTNLEDWDITLWVVGLNDASNYWDSGDGVFWENLAGRDKASLAESSFPNIPARVQKIVSQWFGIRSVTLAGAGNAYYCRPYLSRIVFNAHFNKPGAPLKVIDPNGLPISVSAGTSSRRETYIRFVENDPKPGTYWLTHKNLRRFSYKIFVEEELPTLQFLGPLRTTNQNVETNIVFKVIQDGRALDKPLEEGEHLFDFQGYFQVNHHGGTKQYELLDDSVARHAGRVLVVAYTPPTTSPTGPKTSVPDTALWLYLENPDPQEGLSVWPRTEKATLKMSLYEGNNRVTALKDLVTKPETWLRLEKMDKSGIPLLELPLKVENGYFVADIPIQLEIFKGEGWWYPDKLHLQVVAEPNRLPEGRELNGIWLPKEVEDKRLNANPMTVADIDIIFHWLLRVLIVGLLILTLGIPAWKFASFLLALLNISGEDKGRTVNLLIYDSMDDDKLA